MSAPPRPNRSALSRFLNVHAGARAVIVCNGPSLNRMDLSFLRGEIVFGMNKIHLGLEKFGFVPRYLVAVNDRVIAQETAALAALPCVKFITARMGHLLPEGPLTYHINTDHGLRDRFIHDITMGVREGHTVTHACLQIARYMGFAEVVIVGMDHNFTHKAAPNAVERMEGDDPNHFHPGYFKGHDWEAPNLAESEISYAESRRVFEAEGRRIIDATVDGKCEIFEKADYRRLFGL